MTFYVARHGQTEWNAENKVCGITDIALTEKGIAQADELADQVKGKNIEIIISSPMKRAVTTSQIVSEKCHIPMMIDNRLVEQNYGVYEGVDRNNEDFLANKRNFAYRYPNGESMIQVAVRVYTFLDEIKKQYSGKNVLIVSHGGVCRILKTYFSDMTNEEFFHYTLQNCKLEEYHI
ncbi:MAG: histidine phosphatase family protein [Lachnospiraceae bacterium]|nr:histidine phosphatase family protein [Lachnospiraceae bacterium]